MRDKVPTLEPDQTSRSTGSNQTNICPTNTHRQNAEQDLIGVSRRIAGRLHHRGWAQEEEQGKQGWQMHLQERQKPGKARMYQERNDIHPAAQVWPLQLQRHHDKDQAVQKQRLQIRCGQLRV